MRVMNARFAWLAAGATGLLGCDLVLGLDQYTEGTAGTAAGGGSSTSGSMTTGGSMSTSATMTSSSTGAGPCTPGTTVDCYDGPPGTEGVGFCRKGQGVCKSDGMGVESCDGDVVPTTENPNVTGDENCDGVASGDVAVAAPYGPSCAAVASTKDVYLGGTLVDKLTVGPDTIDVDEFAVYGAKLGPVFDGKWAKMIAEGESTADGCATDSENAFVVGGGIDPATLWSAAPGLGGFVGKIAADGTPVWGHTCVGTSPTGGKQGDIHGVAVDSEDNVIAVGVAASPVNCGSAPTSGPTTSGIFVAKFAKDGTHLWTRMFGNGNPLGVAVDSTDNIWVTGACSGSISFGGTALACATSTDAFIAKFAPSSSHLFSTKFGDTMSQQLGASIVVGPDDGPVVLFTNDGSLDVGGGPQSTPSVIAKFDAAGAYKWNRPIQVRTTGLALDPQGGGATAGGFSGTIDLGGGPMTSISAKDAFLWHFDANGAHVYARQYIGAPGNGSLQIGVVASDADGAFYASGYHSGLIDFGTGVLPGTGYFLLKVAP